MSDSPQCSTHMKKNSETGVRADKKSRPRVNRKKLYDPRQIEILLSSIRFYPTRV